MKTRQRVASFDLAGSDELRDLEDANPPRLILAIDIAHCRVRCAKINADHVAAGLLFGKQVVGSDRFSGHASVVLAIRPFVEDLPSFNEQPKAQAESLTLVACRCRLITIAPLIRFRQLAQPLERLVREH